MTGREERKQKIENKINDMLSTRDGLYADYVASLFSAGMQPTSVKYYLQALMAFMDHIKNDCTTESVKEILPLNVTNYLNHIRTKTNKDGSVVPTSTSHRATIYSALRSFFEFLFMNRIINENPMAYMKRPKVTDEVSQEYLTTEEMKDVFQAVRNGSGAKGKSQTHEMHLRSRDMAILRTLFELGIRCSALTCLDVENVDLENKKIIYKDKGEKVFEKPLSDTLVESLKSWLYDRSKLDDIKTNALFVSEKKKRCSYGTILKIVKTFTKAATGNGMTVHKIRHSAITAVYEFNGNDIVHAAHFAGHNNVTTTQRYINSGHEEKDLDACEFLGSIA